LIKSFLKEPLLHFALLGGLLLTVQGLWGPAEPNNDGRSIIVSHDRVAGLTKAFEARFKRSPDAGETAGLVQNYVNEEILVREGRALLLDQADPVIRRRLIQQMTLILEEQERSKPPTDNEMEAWILAEPSRFATPVRLSFEHAFFSRDGANAKARAQQKQDPGDPFPLGRVITKMTAQKLKEQFGNDFAQALFELPLNVWSPVLPSRLGLHRVKVTHREAVRLPELSELRQKVLSQMGEARRKQAFKKGLERLKKHYKVSLP
jgi:hypothetical protein